MIKGEWIRSTPPENWGVARIKDHATVVNGYPFDSKLFSDNSGYPLVRIRDIKNESTVVGYEGEWIEEATIYRGDILVGMDGDFNVARWRGERSLLNQRVCCIRTKESIDSGYLYYVLPAPLKLINEFTYSTTVKHLSSFDILDIQLPFPGVEMQRLIANYLDRETAHIDTLIAEKERMLALLEEKRAALISQAVTRGLDPDVPLKPSGLDWLGDIPEHWESISIKYLAIVGNGSTPSVENENYWENDGFPWLNSSVVNAEYVAEPSRRVSKVALKECHLPIIEPPAVLVGITGQGKTRGMATILTYQATINQHMAFVKTQEEKLDAEYLRFMLERAYSFLRKVSDGAGSTKGAITCEQLANFRIPVPPIEEQISIVKEVLASKAGFQQLCQELSISVELLKERRSALITAAVTGQLDIDSMNASAGEPACA